jgi:hypothetical protein
MPKYLCLQRNQPGRAQGPKPSPAEMQEMFASFNAWKEKFQSNLVDMGGKLARASTVVTTEGVSDGPLVETKELIGGYMIVEAPDLERALEVVRESPGVVMPGSSVEVREISTH